MRKTDMPGDDVTIYLNGTFVPKAQASMPIEDRGTLFADGVYEVFRFYAGRPFAVAEHLQRMRRSLSGVQIQPPEDFSQAPKIAQTLLDRNHLSDATVYWQITRGAAPRNLVPPPGLKPTVLMIPKAVAPLDPKAPVPTVTAMLTPDQRWSNCWIKSLMLLPNVLATQAAQQAGYDSAILHRGNVVTEATNANVMVILDGELWTHPADHEILDGVTRRQVLDLARALGLTVHEQAVTTDQLLNADEVILTGTTAHVTAITHVNSQPIGQGTPGPVTRRLHEALCQHVQDVCLSG